MLAIRIIIVITYYLLVDQVGRILIDYSLADSTQSFSKQSVSCRVQSVVGKGEKYRRGTTLLKNLHYYSKKGTKLRLEAKERHVVKAMYASEYYFPPPRPGLCTPLNYTLPPTPRAGPPWHYYFSPIEVLRDIIGETYADSGNKKSKQTASCFYPLSIVGASVTILIIIYRAFHKLPQIYNANHVTFPIQRYATPV